MDIMILKILGETSNIMDFIILILNFPNDPLVLSSRTDVINNEFHIRIYFKIVTRESGQNTRLSTYARSTVKNQQIPPFDIVDRNMLVLFQF
jgi:hypothetical protein